MPRLLAIFLLPLAAFAADTTVKGYLVDSACGYEYAKTEGFGARHTKACLEMNDCARSGYGILTSDHKLLLFDKAGSDRAKEFLAGVAKKNDLRVTVTGAVSGDKMTVAGIELQ